MRWHLIDDLDDHKSAASCQLLPTLPAAWSGTLRAEQMNAKTPLNLRHDRPP